MADISNDFVLFLAAFAIKAILLGFVAWVGILLTSNVNLKNRIAVAALAGMIFLPVCSLLLPPLNLPITPSSTFVAVHHETEPPRTLSAQPFSEFNPHLDSPQDISGDSNPFQMNIALVPPTENDPASAKSDFPELVSQLSETVSQIDISYFTSKFNLTIWQNYVVVIYLAGIVLLLGRVIIGLLSISSVIRRSKPIPSLESKPDSHAKFYESSEIEAPMMFGVHNPTILLPSTWTQWSQGKLASISDHELAHVGRKDWLVALVAEINSALFWFHPMAWIVRSYLAKTAEVCCDDTVISNANGPGASEHRIRYAKHLLEIASDLSHSRSRIDRSALALTMANTSAVEERIDSILNFKRSLASPLGRTSIACVSMIMLAFVTFTAVLAASPTENITPPAESIAATEASTSDENNSQTKPTTLGEPMTPETDQDLLIYKGRVLDSNGAPVKDAKIYMVPALLSSEQSRLQQLAPSPKPICLTDESGMFSFEKKIHDSDLNYSQFLALWEVESIIAVTQDLGFVNADALAFETTSNWQGRTANLTAIEKRVNKSKSKLNSVLRLPKLAKPITGTVVDSNGTPLEGAAIKITAINDMSEDPLESFYNRSTIKMFQAIRLETLSEFDQTKTDSTGSFTLSGVSERCIVHLAINSPNHVITSTSLHNIPPIPPKPKVSTGETADIFRARLAKKFLHPSGHQIVLEKSEPVQGTVRHAETGRPLPGVLVHSRTHYGGKRQFGNSLSFDLTDEKGKFTLRGLPIVDDNPIFFVGSGGLPILKKATNIDTSASLQMDIELETGSLVMVNAVDRRSGKTIRGTAAFWPIDKPFDVKDGVGARTTPDGNAEFMAQSTTGYLTFVVGGKLSGDFPYVDLPADVSQLVDFPKQIHFIKKMDLAADQEVIDVSVEWGSTSSARIKLICPDGTTLDAVDNELIAFGLSIRKNDMRVNIRKKHLSQWEAFDGEIRGKIEDPRLVVVVDQKNKLVGSIELKTKPEDLISLPMKPWGIAKGQILDSKGQPMPNARITVNTTTKTVRELTQGIVIGRVIKEVDFPYPDMKPGRMRPKLFDLRTDADGNFKLHGLVPGQPYRIAVEGEPYNSFTTNRNSPNAIVHYQRHTINIFESSIEPGYEIDLGQIKVGQETASPVATPTKRKW